MQNVQDMHDLKTEIFRLDGDEQVTPFMKTMCDAECGEPAQSSGKIKSGTLSRLQNDGKAQKEKDQSVDKVDHGSID